MLFDISLKMSSITSITAVLIVYPARITVIPFLLLSESILIMSGDPAILRPASPPLSLEIVATWIHPSPESPPVCLA